MTQVSSGYKGRVIANACHNYQKSYFGKMYNLPISLAYLSHLCHSTGR